MDRAAKERLKSIGADSFQPVGELGSSSLIKDLADLESLFLSRPLLHPQLAFLRAYQASTISLQSAEAHGDCSAALALRRIAHDFASRYFTALRAGLLQHNPPPHWHPYFAYTQNAGKSGLLALLLGVRAHISGDLPGCLQARGGMALEDFQWFDGMLRSLVPSALIQSSSAAPIRWMSGRFELCSLAYRLTIERWRHQAWRRAVDPFWTPARIHKSCQHAGWQMIAFLDPFWLAKHRTFIPK